MCGCYRPGMIHDWKAIDIDKDKCFSKLVFFKLIFKIFP